MRKRWQQVTVGVLAGVVLGVVFWSVQPVTAEDDQDEQVIKKLRGQTRALVVEGCTVTYEQPTANAPYGMLVALNPQGRSIEFEVEVWEDCTSVSPLSRMPAMPVRVWQRKQIVKLAPQQTRRIVLAKTADADQHTRSTQSPLASPPAGMQMVEIEPKNRQSQLGNSRQVIRRWYLKTGDKIAQGAQVEKWYKLQPIQTADVPAEKQEGRS